MGRPMGWAEFVTAYGLAFVNDPPWSRGVVVLAGLLVSSLRLLQRRDFSAAAFCCHLLKVGCLRQDFFSHACIPV